MSDLKIIHCSDPAELYHRYSGQSEAQPAYIELDLRQGTLRADHDAEIGNATPFSVVHGFERRWPVPIFTAEAANRTLDELAPQAQRILNDWDQGWDERRGNIVVTLGEDAREADAQIDDLLGIEEGQSQGFDESDLVVEWELDGAVNGDEAEEFGITAETSDERLEEIADEITQNLAEINPSGVAVVPALEKHLSSLRDEAAQEDMKDLYAIVAATGDRVDGAEMAEVDRDATDHLWTLEAFTAMAREAGYGPEQPDVLIYLQTEDEELSLPDGFAHVRLDVPSRVAAAVAAVERAAR